MLNITEQFSHLWSGWGAGRVRELSVQSFSHSYLFWLGPLSLELESQHSVIHVAYNMLRLYWPLREGCGWRRKKIWSLIFPGQRQERHALVQLHSFCFKVKEGEKIWRLTHLLHYVWRKDSWGEGPTEDVRELLVQASNPHALKVPVGVDDGLPRPSGLWFSWGRIIKIRLLRNTKEIKKDIIYLYLIYQGYTLCQINWCIKHLRWQSEEVEVKPHVFWLPSSGTVWLLHYLKSEHFTACWVIGQHRQQNWNISSCTEELFWINLFSHV